MMDKCFDIGVIQTFVDGELNSLLTGEVVRHISACDDCANLVTELGAENELAFDALEHEYNVLVPTERLRTKLFASIKEIEANRSVGFWTVLIAGFSNLVARPGVAAAAVILLFAGFALTGVQYIDWLSGNAGGDVTSRNVPEAEVVPSVKNAVETTEASDSNMLTAESSKVAEPAVSYAAEGNEPTGIRVINSDFRETHVNRAVRVRPVAAAAPAATVVRSANIEAEDGYLLTIATLNRTVNDNKDYILRPSERVAFERDLAVVDDAIKKMRGEVESNPNNNGAREILRSSYKNKINLLSSVADRAEIVASLD